MVIDKPEAKRKHVRKTLPYLDLGPTATKSGRYPIERLNWLHHTVKRLQKYAKRLEQTDGFTENDLLNLALFRLESTPSTKKSAWLIEQIHKMKEVEAGTEKG